MALLKQVMLDIIAARVHIGKGFAAEWRLTAEALNKG